MRKILIIPIIILFLITGCKYERNEVVITTTPSAEPIQTIDVIEPTPTPTHTPTPTPEPTPTPTPEPTPNTITIGAVGDIMMMTSQISNAKTKDGYDFTDSFIPMESHFKGVDLMCGNLELTFAGPNKPYTQPRPEEVDPNTGKRPFQTFSAPDELAKNLAFLGFDVLTTANNHCLDRGADGVFRTLDVLDEANIYHTGTSRSVDEKNTPLICDVNGIKVGIVAVTTSVNRREYELDGEQKKYAVNRMDDDTVKKLISDCRQAGAQVIVLFPHWGIEYEQKHNSTQKEQALKYISYGADIIIGSHPHVVQDCEYISANRDGKEITVPVIYSMGNFISNMSPSPRNYGLFASISITQQLDGTITIGEFEFTPVLCSKASGIHEVIPCTENDDKSSLKECYEHVMRTLNQ